MTPPPRVISYQRSALLGLLLLVGAGAAFVFFRFNPTGHSFFPTCVFYRVTGLYCPGCGAQRSLHALLHGELLTALHFNPLFVLALPFLAFAAGRYLWRELTGATPAPIVIRPFWIVLLAVVVVAFGILRNLPFAPFTYLAPP
jgi:hypothetical protein